jgi:hypothetical protein
MHDLPHLVVESVFCLDDGLWASLVGQGEYPGLTPGHLAAKALTNAITNRFGDGPDTPDGVRARLGARDAPLLNDDDLEIAIAAVRRAFAQWAAVDVGGKLSLAWPLSPDECRDLAQA